jgi:RNA polymerase sigma-70 factor (ECF subfamily)
MPPPRELFAGPRAILQQVDDVGLLLKARTGDEAAFSELFGRYQRPIYLYAVRMCGREAGDDVVQETFLAVLRQTGTFDRARGTVAGYLFGIARHLVLKQLGSRYAACAPGADDPEGVDTAGPEQSALEALTRAEMVDAVRTAVDALPPVFREVVVLCELQEMDYATAAEVIQCPIGTIRSRLHRARRMLLTTLSAVRPLTGARRR